MHSHVPQLRVQGEGSRGRRHGRHLPQRLGRRVSVPGLPPLRRAFRLRHEPAGLGELRVGQDVTLGILSCLSSSLLLGT